MLYPFYDLMIFIYNPKELKLSSRKLYKSGGPSPATNIPVVHTLLMAIQSTFDLEPEEPRKRYEKNGRVAAIIFVQ